MLVHYRDLLLPVQGKSWQSKNKVSHTSQQGAFYFQKDKEEKDKGEERRLPIFLPGTGEGALGHPEKVGAVRGRAESAAACSRQGG